MTIAFIELTSFPMHPAAVFNLETWNAYQTSICPMWYQPEGVQKSR